MRSTETSEMLEQKKINEGILINRMTQRGYYQASAGSS
jgi:hypothetical protein